MSDYTERLMGLLWASKGKMITGSALAIAGVTLAMRGAYWEGVHAMLAAMARGDKEKTREILDEIEMKNRTNQ